jgi:hypothetical protein
VYRPDPIIDPETLEEDEEDDREQDDLTQYLTRLYWRLLGRSVVVERRFYLESTESPIRFPIESHTKFAGK